MLRAHAEALFFLLHSTTWISEVCRRAGPAARRTGAERVRAPTATVAALVSTAARRAPPPAATRPSDSLGWPDGPRGTLAALGFPFCFSRKNLACPNEAYTSSSRSHPDEIRWCSLNKRIFEGTSVILKKTRSHGF